MSYVGNQPPKTPIDPITSTEIDDGTIVGGDIANAAITEAKVANNAISTDKIVDSAVTTAKINNGAVTVAKVSADIAIKTQANTFVGAQRASSTAVTSSSGTINIDLSVNNDFTHTFTENTTLANPTNIVEGQSGAIRLTQHASSPKTLAYGSFWKFPNGTVPSVSTTNSAADTLYYYVRSSTFIEANLVKGFA